MSQTAQSIWTFAHLTPEQLQALKEAEATLGAGVLLAFQRDEARPSQLTQSQLERLQELEKKLGITIVAVR